MFKRLIIHYITYIGVVNCARLASETKSVGFLWLGSIIAFVVFVLWFPMFIHKTDTEDNK